MPRANTQAVRISNDLLEEIRKASVASGRSIPMEIEHRLRQTLEPDAIGRMSPWARTIGRHMAYLADCAEDASTVDAALIYMKSAAAAYLDTLLAAFRDVLGADELKSAEADVREAGAVAGEGLAQEVRRAHDEPPKQPNDILQAMWEAERRRNRRSQQQLLEDQKVLLVSPEALGKIAAAIGERPRRKGSRK